MIILARLVAGAAIGIAWSTLFSQVGALSTRNSLLRFMTMLYNVGPTVRNLRCAALCQICHAIFSAQATTLVIMCQLLNTYRVETATLVFWQYAAAFFTLPIVATFAVMLTL